MLLRSIVYILISFTSFFILKPDTLLAQAITRKQAVHIAEATKEVGALYDLQGGQFINCIEISVVKACESDWVTCVEDAWVVQFMLGDICGVIHDERFGVTLLIDAATGDIKSIFPEINYFLDGKYCLEDDDCLCPLQDNALTKECWNFIYGPLTSKKNNDVREGTCEDNRCVIAK